MDWTSLQIDSLFDVVRWWIEKRCKIQILHLVARREIQQNASNGDQEKNANNRNLRRLAKNLVINKRKDETSPGSDKRCHQVFCCSVKEGKPLQTEGDRTQEFYEDQRTPSDGHRIDLFIEETDLPEQQRPGNEGDVKKNSGNIFKLGRNFEVVHDGTPLSL